METIEINANVREIGNKGAAGRLRRLGKLPAIFYGPKSESLPLVLDRKEFLGRVGVLEGSHLIRIKSSSSLVADKVALVKEMQYHPVTGEVIHADFYEVDLTQRIQVNVPLHFVGRAQGVVKGGILQPIVREIEVECLPLDIPEFFEVDVSSLDIGDNLHVASIAMPEDIKALYETDYPIVAVVPPSVEEAPAPAEALPAEGEAAAPETTEEKKKPEGQSS